MRTLILGVTLAFGVISTLTASSAVAQAPGYGPGTPGVGKTMVLAGPAARARIGRCGRRHCRAAVIGRVRPVAPATVPRPAAGYAPPMH